MTYKDTYSGMAFRFAVVVIVLVWISMSIFFLNPANILGVVICIILLIMSSILSLIGFAFNIKGIREPNNIKKICSLIVNSLIGGSSIAITMLLYLQEITS